ncbi:MarR family winged helix-turn-helix transcriptional regulator [Bacillus sp. 1P06AnD]|uniref:MarR family winged helix-turn-helix transcriptional regulator n=1 Tax=Bacillus sp. 1P06AnD TaxID=3132208 RepID=UPI0039A073FE
MGANEELFEVTSMFQTFLKGISQNWKKEGYSISINQFKVLRILATEGPQKVSELANILCLSSAAITGVTDQLDLDGYVHKERCSQDRRAVIITITETGKSMDESIVNSQSGMFQSYFQILSRQDIQHLKRIFSMLNSNF